MPSKLQRLIEGWNSTVHSATETSPAHEPVWILTRCKELLAQRSAVQSMVFVGTRIAIQGPDETEPTPPLKEDDIAPFYRLLERAFLIAALLALRTLQDNKPQVLSLPTLLTDWRDASGGVTLDRLTTVLEKLPTNLAMGLGPRELSENVQPIFGRWATVDCAELDPARFSSAIDALKAAVQPLLPIMHNAIAHQHMSRLTSQHAPKLELHRVDACIETMHSMAADLAVLTTGRMAQPDLVPEDAFRSFIRAGWPRVFEFMDSNLGRKTSP